MRATVNLSLLVLAAVTIYALMRLYLWATMVVGVCMVVGAGVAYVLGRGR
jgi:hypothetical protein